MGFDKSNETVCFVLAAAKRPCLHQNLTSNKTDCTTVPSKESSHVGQSEMSDFYLSTRDQCFPDQSESAPSWAAFSQWRARCIKKKSTNIQAVAATNQSAQSQTVCCQSVSSDFCCDESEEDMMAAYQSAICPTVSGQSVSTKDNTDVPVSVGDSFSQSAGSDHLNVNLESVVQPVRDENWSDQSVRTQTCVDQSKTDQSGSSQSLMSQSCANQSATSNPSKLLAAYPMLDNERSSKYSILIAIRQHFSHTYHTNMYNAAHSQHWLQKASLETARAAPLTV